MTRSTAGIVFTMKKILLVSRVYKGIAGGILSYQIVSRSQRGGKKRKETKLNYITFTTQKSQAWF